ncbi:MAG: beta-galactosidase [Lachnospiraceae bacterium]|nr:beta-galactosidase [Lachnospiraceae bacterium]
MNEASVIQQQEREGYAPLFPSFPHFLHGGDYNPEQWMETPEIWDEDMRLMKLAGCNQVSMGIFSWAELEPEEGVYNFSFLDTMMDKCHANGIKVILATPTGAKPNWMAAKYPEIRRMTPERVREFQGERHNHCYTSPVYREKAAAINRKLAERYKDHPALLAWHISNEFGGICFCPLCAEAFRGFLKTKYGTLDKLNHQYWARFWSHTYTSWSQIEPPSPIGEHSVHALKLDWMRFVTHQTVDFMKAEVAPLKELTPHLPVTTNMMDTYELLDYTKFREVCDFASWDNYPTWNGPEHNTVLPADRALAHDQIRCLFPDRPFLLMESTPSQVNWHPVNKLKRPGVHILSSMQAVAQGSDSVQYFQWRKSRGSCEKFHGAVVDHVGHEHTRVFREVARMGDMLKQMDAVIGSRVKAEAAVIWDQENRWILHDFQGFNRQHMDYEETVRSFYRAFWNRNVNVDVIDSLDSFEGYKLVIAPMLYMLKPGVAERLKAFVAAGGTLVGTYLTGMVNENDLCFLGGMPGDGLREVFGLWQEDVDALYDGETVPLKPMCGSASFFAKEMCALIHAETAQVRAVYDGEFYKGEPAVTVNAYGEGRAWYVAPRCPEFNDHLVGNLIRSCGIRPNVEGETIHNVHVSSRENDTERFLFFQNYTDQAVTVDLTCKDTAHPGRDLFTGEEAGSALEMEPYGVRVLVEKK